MIEGFWLLVLAATVGGLVRGFSGFGTAMVYLPIAGQVLPPFEAITTLIMMDLVGPLPNVPRALRDGQLADVRRLVMGLLVAMPLGIAVLSVAEPEVFRYIVSGVSLVLLVALVAGFRYQGRLTPPKVLGVGGLSGFLGGVCGVAGPPVILFYMASPLPVAAIRANMLLFLLAMDVVMLALYALSGNLAAGALFVGVLLIAPYTLANMAGAAIFNPKLERVYRATAYLIIAGSAILGLPIWD